MSARSLGLDNWAQNLRGWPLASARARFARQAPELPRDFDPTLDLLEDVLVAGALDADLFEDMIARLVVDDEERVEPGWNPFVEDFPPTIEEWPIGTCDFEVEPYLEGDIAVQSFLRSMGLGSWLTSMPTRYPSIRVEGGSRA